MEGNGKEKKWARVLVEVEAKKERREGNRKEKKEEKVLA